MVNFHVMKIFSENIEILENLPAQTEIFPCIDKNFSRMLTYMVIFNIKYAVTAVKWSKRLQAMPRVFGSNPAENFKLQY
jgi:hypothetical protein